MHREDLWTRSKVIQLFSFVINFHEKNKGHAERRLMDTFDGNFGNTSSKGKKILTTVKFIFNGNVSFKDMDIHVPNFLYLNEKNTKREKCEA